MNDVKTFGQWLKQRRKGLGLTQTELAQQAGCAAITLRRIESDDLHASEALAASLAKALGAAEADLPGILTAARSAGDSEHTALFRSLLRNPNNLPAQLTPLFGREHDIAGVRKRLLSDGARLVTLLGPPGVGKTRLAQAVAEEVLDAFEHGAFFVPLAPIVDSALVASVIAQALGLQTTGPTPPALQLRAYLEEKHLLLVLDNFEHLVEAAPLVDDLLRRCPWLHVLVTSRQPLRVRGERQMTVRPLALPVEHRGTQRPAAEDVLRYPAVAMFAERAETILHDFAVTDANAATVAELCRRLDGLPLAIELIAARIKLFTPQDLLARLSGPLLLSADGLRDVEPRQRTLRGALDWSYNLLDPVEQAVFARLAVFVGGCKLEAAESVCGDEEWQVVKEGASKNAGRDFDPLASKWASIAAAKVIDSLASLLDKGLIQRQLDVGVEPRYAPITPIREYALERLRERDEDEPARWRHLAYYIHWVDQTAHGSDDAKQATWYRNFKEELHNVQAAWDWAVAQCNVAALEQAYHNVFHFYEMCSYFQEGKDRFANAVEMVSNLPPGTDVNRILGLLVGRLGWFMFQMGHLREAQQQLQRSLDLLRPLQEEPLLPFSLNYLGAVNFYLGEYPAAQVLCDEALQISTAQDLWRSTAVAKTIQSQLALAQGNYGQARQLATESLVIDRAHGNLWGTAFSLVVLGRVAHSIREYAQAEARLMEALEIRRTVDDQRGQAQCLTLLGKTAADHGQVAQATRYYEQALAIYESIGNAWGAADTLRRLGRVALDQGQQGYAGACLAKALRLAWTTEAVPMQLAVLAELAVLHYDAATERAATLAILVRVHPAATEASRDRVADVPLAPAPIDTEGVNAWLAATVASLLEE